MNHLSTRADADDLDTLATRVLVADDDPASRRFLGDGLRSMGAVVQTAADGSAALQHAHTEAFDLLLLDCRMPGAGALEILLALRQDLDACSTDSVAVATTAELASGDRQALLAAGFSDILLKPCDLTRVQDILMLAQPAQQRRGVLDDVAALRATGDATTMIALRSLLRDELVVLVRELDDLTSHAVRFSERLHRLRSSCGFCGASALSAQVLLMQQQLARRGTTPAAVARFRAAVLATLGALGG